MTKEAATLRLRLTPVAEAQLRDVRRRAEAAPHTFEDAVWGWVKTNLELVLRRPSFALEPDRLLGVRKHDFTGIRKVKFKNAKRGMRIIYIVSEPLQTTTVLMFGERIQDAADDVYEELALHLAAGNFDDAFADLNMPRPPGLL
ncbi:MAG: hypothetical protein WKG00_01795 [Polyangiaceae bacterium]